MATKTILLLCVQTLMIQSALSRCVSLESSFVPSASNGGSFVVTSSSPVAPTGVSIVSENVYEGPLMIGGNLPLLGSVGVEGEFLTGGSGAVSYGCGSEAVIILTEQGPVFTGIVMPGYGPLSFGYAPYFTDYLYGFPGMYGYGYGYY